MYKGVHVQGDSRTKHGMKAPPAAKMTGEKPTGPRDIRLPVRHADGESPDIWGELEKRLEKILEHA